jgi:phosphatidylserine/phosphatidylglycerophosphate/cardiolipin synthase-like enzyme
VVAGAAVSAVAAAVNARARVRRVPLFPPGAEAITAVEARGYIVGLAAAPRVGRPYLAVSFAPAIATSVEPLVHGREYFPQMIEDIAAATSSIHLRELVDGGIAVVMNEGLFPDIEGPLGGARRLDRRFDDLGHFDHPKMMVVDGRIAYVGGTGSRTTSMTSASTTP